MSREPSLQDKGDELRREYQLRFEKGQGYRQRVWKLLTSDFFQEIVGKGKAVLDLGSGWGEFINQIQASKKYGMDLNPDGRERLAEDVTFLNQDCSADWPLPEASLDVVFTSNFFEHLPSKDLLQGTVVQARRCLKPGGRLICMGPNIKFLPGSYWDFWDHHVALTESSLSELLRLESFTIERCIPRFLPYSMSTGIQPPLIFLRLYLRMPIMWRFFGHQFLVIGIK